MFDYTGTWNSSSSSSKFRGDDHYSSTAGSTYSYKFIGTKATLYATKDKHHGIAAVSIDGGSEKMVDLYSSSRSHQAVIFTSPELPSSSHTIRVRVTGNKSPSSSGTVVTADRLDVVSTLSSKRAAADVDAPPGKLLWKADFSEGKADLNPEVENDDGLLTFPTPSYSPDGKVMRSTFLKNVGNSHRFRSRFHNAAGAKGKHLNIGAQDEVYLKYSMYIPSSTSLEFRGKLPGLGGLPDSQSGWYTSTGGDMKPDSFSARLHVRPSSEYSVGYPYLDAYIYAWHAAGKNYGDAGYEYGISIPFTTDANNQLRSGKNMRIPRDKWFDVQMRIKLNTPGQNNGVFEAWMDGVKAISLHDVQWNKSGVNTKINQLIGEIFANSPGYPSNGYIDYDNFYISSP